ncbi:MAG: glycoside hydrolase family 127 protein [Phycisphaerae bacterium]|nr:glycoside hydrolase family 127 protein [Phycisphaerae bacterium]
MLRYEYFIVIVVLLLGLPAASGGIDRVSFTDVHISDDFWSGRIETNRTVTIPFDFQKCEETGRISNFAKAGGLIEGDFEGIYFNDSDLYKIIEGAAYSLASHPDPQLEAYVDSVIDKIAAAQWSDGYLYTFYSLPKHQPEKRWTDLQNMHELYCAGHFFEGAVAYYEATGKRKILDIAIRLADHIDGVFGEGKKMGVPGHQEIEIGLVRLYQATGQKRYLTLARFFLDRRGDSASRKIFGPYCQDHQKVIDQEEAVGHAVRAGYLYSGMADVATMTGDKDYVNAIKKIWRNVVEKKIYLTGGVGARHGGEAYGDNYELPNLTAYNETCAAVANAMWNHRLFLLEGDSQYIDVLERVLYNGFLSGVSLSGDSFFYPNPLASVGNYQRSPWFGCSCCPSNVVRFVPSIANYIYAKADQRVYVNLYVTSDAEIQMKDEVMKISQAGKYPWNGSVRVTVKKAMNEPIEMCLRLPGWARGQCMPGDLYRYTGQPAGKIIVRLNGKPITYETEKGYAVIKRKWKDSDFIELELPMPIRRVVANPKVKDDRGRVAFERGPIVYCLEAADNPSGISNLVFGPDVKITPVHRADMFDGVTVLQGVAKSLKTEADDRQVLTDQPVLAIPYYAWAHRGAGEMAVWLAKDKETAVPLKKPTIASQSKVTASHFWTQDTGEALNDQMDPKNSGDHDVPRFTWWDHKGTNEWVQYDFTKETAVSQVAVYWFDDTGRGQCRAPHDWHLLYRNKNGQWTPVKNSGDYGLALNKFNEVSFEEVTTSALRLEVKLKDNFSSGLLEWKVD